MCPYFHILYSYSYKTEFLNNLRIKINMKKKQCIYVSQSAFYSIKVFYNRTVIPMYRFILRL